MNVTDYAYTSKEDDGNSNSCVNQVMNNVNCKNNNWLYSGQTGWTPNAYG